MKQNMALFSLKIKLEIGTCIVVHFSAILQYLDTNVGFTTIQRRQCWFYYNTKSQSKHQFRFYYNTLTPMLVLLQYRDANVGFITIQRRQCWFYYNTGMPMLVLLQYRDANVGFITIQRR